MNNRKQQEFARRSKTMFNGRRPGLPWLTAAALALLCIATAGLAERPAAASAVAHAAAEEPTRFGLNGISFFHYRNAPDATKTAVMRMRCLKQAGATCDRFDLWWSEMEPQRGTWKWDKADWLIDFYAGNHVEMLPILSCRAAWMTQPPHTADDFTQFAGYVRQVVRRYKGRIHTWEVWNEPNIPTFWKPPSAADYTELLKAAYAAAHQEDPQCVVVGASANETDINWLRDIAARGGLQFMDAVSLHPYSMADGPEQMDLARQLQNVKTFLRQQGKAELPVWVTEMGWTSSVDNAASMQKASRYLAQTFVVAASEGISHLFWFNLQDWMEGSKLEGWGLISPEGKPKLPLVAYRHMAQALEGAKFAGYLPLEHGEGYLFRRGGVSILVAWAHHGKSQVLLSGRGAVVTDIYGARIPQGDGVMLNDSPILVENPSRGLLRRVAGRRPHPSTNNLLANPTFAVVESSGHPYGWGQGVFYGGGNKGAYNVDTLEDGSHVVSLADTTDALWESWPVPAMPGEHYTLTAEVRPVNATGENGVQILFLSGPGWGWRGGPTSSTVTGTNKGWRTVRVQGIVPDDADVVRVNLVSKNNTGVVFFRNIRLVRGGK